MSKDLKRNKIIQAVRDIILEGGVNKDALRDINARLDLMGKTSNENIAVVDPYLMADLVRYVLVENIYHTMDDKDLQEAYRDMARINFSYRDLIGGKRGAEIGRTINTDSKGLFKNPTPNNNQEDPMQNDANWLADFTRYAEKHILKGTRITKLIFDKIFTKFNSEIVTAYATPRLTKEELYALFLGYFTVNGHKGGK